jgi:hypothetical protein
LQDLGVDVAVLWPHLFDGRQVRRLLAKPHRDAALLPSQFPFFQSRVGELATAPQDRRQRLFLLGRWQQLALVGFAHTLLFHTNYCAC